MSRASFEAILREGKPNSLGRTVEVVDLVLADRRKLQSLYQCYSSDDEWVRLRVSSAFKRIFRERPDWFPAWANRFIDEVAAIDQPSAHWTVSQLVEENTALLEPDQLRRAKRVVKKLLETTDDWIVENTTMQTLSIWAHSDGRLRTWLRPRLKTKTQSPRKSVANRARKLLAALD